MSVHNAKEPLERAVVDAVRAFDSAARQYAKQLAERVPMKPERREALDDFLFHNLKKAEAALEQWFGIDLFKRISADDAEFIRRMFLRRHVYEHDGGQVTQRYLHGERGRVGQAQAVAARDDGQHLPDD